MFSPRECILFDINRFSALSCTFWLLFAMSILFLSKVMVKFQNVPKQKQQKISVFSFENLNFGYQLFDTTGYSSSYFQATKLMIGASCVTLQAVFIGVDWVSVGWVLCVLCDVFCFVFVFYPSKQIMGNIPVHNSMMAKLESADESARYPGNSINQTHEFPWCFSFFGAFHMKSSYDVLFKFMVMNGGWNSVFCVFICWALNNRELGSVKLLCWVLFIEVGSALLLKWSKNNSTTSRSDEVNANLLMNCSGALVKRIWYSPAVILNNDGPCYFWVICLLSFTTLAPLAESFGTCGNVNKINQMTSATISTFCLLVPVC